MASFGYETRGLGHTDDLNVPKTEMSDLHNEKETKWSAIQTTDEPPSDQNEPPSDQNESHNNIRDKLNHKCANICGDDKWNVCKQSCSLQIKATPYKSRIIQMPGYQINKENRKWISSVSLAIVLILTGLIGLTLNLVDFKLGEICEIKSEKVNNYLEEYKGVTNYYYLQSIGPRSKNITVDYYNLAVNKYSYKYSQRSVTSTIDKDYLFSKLMKNDTNLTQNCYEGSTNCFLPSNNQTYYCDHFMYGEKCFYDSGTIETSGTKFPIPYRHSDVDLRKLAKCKKDIWMCVPCGSKCVKCHWYTINCDLEGLLDDDDSFDTSLQANFSDVNYEEISDAAHELLWEIYERANVLGSIYCFYMALMIFIGGPYVMTSTRLTTRIRIQLQRLTKIWFIGVMLILWYFAELATLFWGLFVIDTDLNLILKFSLVEPCFADSEFITDLFTGASQICGEIIYSKALYEASRANLRYFELVESTYQYYYFADAAYIKFNPDLNIRYTYNVLSDRIFYNGEYILGKDYNLVYDYDSIDCQVSTLLDYVTPNNADFNFGGFILFSSAIAALFLQPVLANLFKSIFIMIDPLAPYFGRIEIPYQHDPLYVDEAEEDMYEATDGLNEFESNVLNEIHEENRQQRIDVKQAKEDEEMTKIMKFIKKWERTKNVCPLCCWV
eukprot:957821_1